MRILIDTCIFIHLSTDMDLLSDDVMAILEDTDNQICMSAESFRELVVSYNNGGLVSKYWDSARQMIDSVSNEYFITVHPLQTRHMQTYSELQLNTSQKHKDPSDHVIISHAITEHLPLISKDDKFAFYRKQGLDLILNKK